MKTAKRIIARVLSLVMIFTTISNTYLQARANELPGAEGAEVQFAEQQGTQEGVADDFVADVPDGTEAPENDYTDVTEVVSDDTEVQSDSGDGSEYPVGQDPGSEVVTDDGSEQEIVTDDTQVVEDGAPEDDTQVQTAPEDDTRTTEDETQVPDIETTPDDDTDEVKDEPETETIETDNGVIIFYVSKDGGQVSNDEDLYFPADGVNALTGSVAIADNGYIFKNWTADDGTVLSEEAEFLPDAAEADYLTQLYETYNARGEQAEVTYTANFEEKETVYEAEVPSVIRVKVTVSGAAFDREVELIAKQVNVNTREYRDAEAALQDSEKEYESMMALDVHFEDKATGEEVEPNGPVRVEFEVLERAITNMVNRTEGVDEITEDDQIEVHHIVETTNARGETELAAETIADSSKVISDMTNNISSIMKEVTNAIQNIAESAQSTADVSAGIMDSVNQVSGVVADVSGMSEKQNSIAQDLTDVVSRFQL